jgi:hypothetical protein
LGHGTCQRASISAGPHGDEKVLAARSARLTPNLGDWRSQRGLVLNRVFLLCGVINALDLLCLLTVWDWLEVPINIGFSDHGG